MCALRAFQLQLSKPLHVLNNFEELIINNNSYGNEDEKRKNHERIFQNKNQITVHHTFFNNSNVNVRSNS